MLVNVKTNNINIFEYIRDLISYLNIRCIYRKKRPSMGRAQVHTKYIKVYCTYITIYTLYCITILKLIEEGNFENILSL